MSNLEQVHILFRGSVEMGKKLRALALCFEFIAGVLAVYGVFAQGGNWNAWQPLLAFALVAASLGARAWAEHLERFAEICRRESARAYATGAEIGHARLSSLKSDAPSVAEWLANRLPSSTLDTYYSPDCPVGEDRLREIYANSAFHTWHLLNRLAWIIGFLGVSLFLVTFAVVFGLATKPLPPEATARVLDALCSIVLTVISLRAIEVAISAGKSASVTRKIADALITQPLPSGDTLEKLIRDYDFERTGAPPVPTWLYKWRRRRLAEGWLSCKRALLCKK